MSARNKLVVSGAEDMLRQHKEEIAEEFGVHASPASRDVITPKILEDAGQSKEKRTRTNEDM
ncbi:MAG TPA: small, acid-soluble spore protein, alpha/beta type [Bacillales bacterium]|nr:small, acid-soluble spore protein, alpha/beta type [Bacillales bacterium]